MDNTNNDLNVLISGTITSITEVPLHRDGVSSAEYQITLEGKTTPVSVAKEFKEQYKLAVGMQIKLYEVQKGLYTVVAAITSAAKPPKQIAVWGQITKIVPSKETDPTMWSLNLKDKTFSIVVMKAYMLGFNPQVGGYAVKYEDKTLGYLTEEEFNKMKEEGNHGI